MHWYNLQSLDEISRFETEDAQWRAEIGEFLTVFAQTRSEFSEWLKEAAPVPTEIIDVPDSDCQFKIPPAAASALTFAAAPVNATASKTKRKTERQASSSVRRNDMIYSRFKEKHFAKGYERAGLTTAILDELIDWWNGLSRKVKDSEGIIPDHCTYDVVTRRAAVRRAISKAIKERLEKDRLEKEN